MPDLTTLTYEDPELRTGLTPSLKLRQDGVTVRTVDLSEVDAEDEPGVYVVDLADLDPALDAGHYVGSLRDSSDEVLGSSAIYWTGSAITRTAARPDGSAIASQASVDAINNVAVAATVDSVDDAGGKVITLAGAALSDKDDVYARRILIFTDGDAKHVQRRILSYDGDTKQVTLSSPMPIHAGDPLLPAAGDAVLLTGHVE